MDDDYVAQTHFTKDEWDSTVNAPNLLIIIIAICKWFEMDDDATSDLIVEMTSPNIRDPNGEKVANVNESTYIEPLWEKIQSEADGSLEYKLLKNSIKVIDVQTSLQQIEKHIHREMGGHLGKQLKKFIKSDPFKQSESALDITEDTESDITEESESDITEESESDTTEDSE